MIMSEARGICLPAGGDPPLGQVLGDQAFDLFLDARVTLASRVNNEGVTLSS